MIGVKRSWLSLRPRSAQIKLKNGTIMKVSNGDIAAVLAEARPRAAPSAPGGDASPVSGSGVARAAGV